MNMRLSGRDIAMDGTPDDSESEAVAPVAYLPPIATSPTRPKVIRPKRSAAYTVKASNARWSNSTSAHATSSPAAGWPKIRKKHCSSSPTNTASRPNVRQIEAKAMKQMRKEIEG